MAALDSPELAAQVSQTGGLGSLACAMLSTNQIRDAFMKIRSITSKPINFNFFCHNPPNPDPVILNNWKRHLQKYYIELGIDTNASNSSSHRNPFNQENCELMENLKPEVVSFHFGLPDQQMVNRLKKKNIKILSSATSVEEALWLEERGVDAIIAQGSEAGGHRGIFLSSDISTQIGTMALLPQIVDAVKVPVIAAGGISDGRGILASLVLGASAAQLGTAYLFSLEAKTSPLYRHTIKNIRDNQTVLTNVFSGRPARGLFNRYVKEVGPLSELAPPFPLASSAVEPLRKKSEAQGSSDFMQIWCGQAAPLCHEMPASELTQKLANDVQQSINSLSV